MYTEPQIPARWIGLRSASFQTWLTSSCLQLNPTGWCIPSALAAKPRQFHSRKMSVIPHQCSLDGRVTRKQWDQHWPPLPAMLQADVLRKPGFYVLYLLKCGLSPMPTYQLGSIWCTVRKRVLFMTSENEDFVSSCFLFSSDKASDKNLPQHLEHKSLHLKWFQTCFSHLSQPTQRDGCSAPGEGWACAISQHPINWDWEKNKIEPKKVAVR